MKSRCWTLLCLIFLSDPVRLSPTDTLRDSNQVQQDILYHGESGETSGYIQEVRSLQDNSEGLLQFPTNIRLATRKNKQLCPQGATNVGIPKRHGRRSIREEDNPFVNSESNFLNKVMENVSTNTDIKYRTTVSPNVDFNDVRRMEENLPPNSNFTNSTPDVAEYLKTNGSLFTSKTQKSMDLLHTIFESVTESRSMSGTTPLEERGNNNLHEDSIKNLLRKKKFKRKCKKPKAMGLSKRMTKPVDSGHNHKIQSNLTPTSGQTTPVTDKSNLELTSSEAIPVSRKPSPAPTSSEAALVTHKPSAAPTSVHTMLVRQKPEIDEQQTQKIWPNYMITIGEPNRVSQNSWNYKNYPDYSGFETSNIEYSNRMTTN